MLEILPTATEWYDYQWTVTLGCTRVSEGCRHCSAEHMMAHSPQLQKFATIAKGQPKWTGAIEPLPSALALPSKWAKPARVLVCSISDLFHEGLDDEFIDQVIRVIDGHRQHTFAALTKRAERMKAFFEHRFVPPNLRLGVSVESPEHLDRVDALLEIPVEHRVRWVSAEPLLDDLSLAPFLGPERINWVAAGGELGDRARRCEVAWMRRLRDECAQARVPFFTKWILDGAEHRDDPCDVS